MTTALHFGILLMLASCVLACSAAPAPARVYADGEFRDEYVSKRKDLFPEGAAFDDVSESFFAGSLVHGDVTRIGVNNEESVFYSGPDEPGRSTLGMAVDTRARRLWVCAIRDAKSQAGLVWALDIETGHRTYEVVLDDVKKGASCNDVTVDRSGAAYVTDRQNAAIYKVTPEGQATVWSTHPLLEPGTIGLNGIVISSDGATMIVSQYKPAGLLRISMNDPSDVTQIELKGDAFSGGIHIAAGADGLRFHDGRLYVAFDRWVMRLTSEDPSWRAATVESARTPMKYGITALVEAHGALYAANGQTAMFLLGLPPNLPFRLVRLDTAIFDARR